MFISPNGQVSQLKSGVISYSINEKIHIKYLPRIFLIEMISNQSRLQCKNVLRSREP